VRYSKYDINRVKPDFLVPRARAAAIGGRVEATGRELEALDLRSVPDLARRLEESGAEAVAICLLHAYANPAHERALGEHLSTLLPDRAISLSHEISPEAREFDRLTTTIANAYIQPLMSGYLADFQACFEARGLRCPGLMMTAGGGMTTLETAARLPVRLVESGPAGGAILAARLAEQIGAKEVLSFDMGGTTAKLCLIDAFRPLKARKFEIGRAARFVKGSGMPVRIPVIEMIEIGAGGGSLARADRMGRIFVGPESAGAHPGPAAFGCGGARPTVTDADVAQRFIAPESFAEGRLKIDVDAAERALQTEIAKPLSYTLDAAAQGVSDIVDESMAAAGRMHAVESGKDLAARVMIAFGGNGPIHATRVARRAGVRTIVIAKDPGVGSAIGFLLAPVAFEVVRSRYSLLDSLDTDEINRFLSGMVQDAQAVVRSGATDDALCTARSAYMRYHGQGHEIEIALPDRALAPADIEALSAAFDTEYSKQFSRPVAGMAVEILNWGVVVSTKVPQPKPIPHQEERRWVRPAATRRIFCDLTGTWREAAVFDRRNLGPGAALRGPALITEPQTTTFVSADFEAWIDGAGNIWLQQREEDRT